MLPFWRMSHRSGEMPWAMAISLAARMGSSIEGMGLKLFNGVAGFDVGDGVSDRPANMPSCDFSGVFTIVVGVVGRLRLEGDGLFDDAAVQVGGRHCAVPLDGDSHGLACGKTAVSVWNRIRVTDVRFDVEDGCAVDKIDT